MGQHKHNPTALAAANGELPPKPPKISKREMDRIMYAKCQEIIYKPLIETYNKLQVLEDFTKENENNETLL